MLYDMSHKEFMTTEFQNPGSHYRGAPFWAWNCLITKELIDEQVACFKQMGMGGFYIHVRVGLKNQYMDEEFLELVRYCDEKAKENGLLCYLYDEDRYSSGIAGGEVTKTIPFRARSLRLTTQKTEGMEESVESFEHKQSRNEKVKGCLRKTYDIVIKDGYLQEARLIRPEEEAEGVKWYLYEELAKVTPWCNNQTYVDTMNPRATECFIEKTHEKYASVLQEEFGKSIPAIFTDEPRISGMRFPDLAQSTADVLLPFSEALPDKFRETCGLDFYESIPDMIWNREGREVSPERYYLMESCCEQFVSSYCEPIGKWCDEHGILFTGHVMAEDSLGGQTGAVGEAMRCYRAFQLPGIDNLCDLRQFATAKQAASASHQYGREGVMSELYGVTQWDFNFEGYKLAGDWQAALGVTARVPHLAWAAMEGEAKRDYPAAIGWQSPWYRHFSYIEDHFARVNYCMTRGVPLVHVGVLHPIETMWLYQGPRDQTGMKQKQLEMDFQNITEWLLTGGIDFDYISQSSLDDLAPLNDLPLSDDLSSRQEDAKFRCGHMEYDVLLIPDCIHLRGKTLKLLVNFLDRGGKVILCGDEPRYVDCKPSEALQNLLLRCERVSVASNALLEALAPWRELDIRDNRGNRKDIYLHQFRQEGDSRWLFLAQAYKGMQARGHDVWGRRFLHAPEHLTIRLKGMWELEKYDTLTGESSRIESQAEDGNTFLQYEMYGDDSLLLHMVPAAGGQKMPHRERKPQGRFVSREHSFVPESFRYETDEPNVLLLDKFEYALEEDKEYQAECEILRMDNLLRERLGYSLRSELVEQPYARNWKDIRNHVLRLRFMFDSSVSVSDCLLALEESDFYSGSLNGEPICMEPVGYYVDKAIQTVKLPDIKVGKNELLLHVKYGASSNLEWMYLLGEFGVALRGNRKSITPKPERLLWGDYTGQGFPFYTGNMTYFITLENDQEGGKTIQIPYYSGAAVKVSVNGGAEHMAAFLPYECPLEELMPGDNLIALTCLGNRYNGFGQLHMIGDDIPWLGPNSWRTEGTSWTENYQLRPMGILTAPIVKED